jgi:hypothetical protein
MNKGGNMLRIFYKIKLFLYKIKLLKPDTLLKKLEVLKLANISLYDEPYRYILINSIETDITEYKDELVRINTSNLLSEYFNYKPRSSDNYITTQAYAWCSYDNKIIPNSKDIFLEWIIEAEIFIKTIETHSVDFNNNYGYTNSTKLRPYIINLDYIISSISNVILKQ